MKKTKIICTLGPAVDTDERVRALLEAGMNAARLNFSHGSHEEHAVRIDRVRRISDELGIPCAVVLDTQGPEIRTGRLEEGKVTLVQGEEIVLTRDETPGNAQKVFQNCASLPASVREGTHILIDDGLLELEVLSVAENDDIHCRILNGGTLGERKSINVPGVDSGLPAVTEKDRADLLFGIEQGVDFIAASFIRSGEGVREVRNFLDANGGSHIGIISKIESQDAVDNILDIIAESDAVMVARGDLGVEVPAHKVPHIQKEIIRLCNKNYTPVITATQMLDSMIRNPRPTRAEAADVANAIYDGTDCIMLSGETASGDWPVEAVQTMARIALESEEHLFQDANRRLNMHDENTNLTSKAVGHAAVRTANNIGATCIIAPTMTGRTARMMSSMRPRIPIYAVTPLARTMRRMLLLWGVCPTQGDVNVGGVGRMISEAQRVLTEKGYLNHGDIAVVTLGDPATSPMNQPDDGGASNYAPTNLMAVIEVR